MPPAQNGPNPGGHDIETAIEKRVQGIESGHYAKLNEQVLRSRFLEWLTTNRDVAVLEDVDTLDCRRFAQYLQGLVDDGDLAASTANRDFDVLRAFFSWCVDDERLPSNPAEPKRASDPLPTDPGTTDQQSWTPEQRILLLRHVDRRADRAFDTESSVDPIQAQRDRALVYLLAHSAVRIGEIVRDPADDARNGLSWDHIDSDRGIVHVYGKVREWQTAPLSSETVRKLDRYERVLEPPSDEWPVFPTRHIPTVSKRVRQELDEERVETLLEDHSIHEIARQQDVLLPSISTNGARSVLQRLCEEADVEVEEGYLRPHGGRRAAGHAVYFESSAEDAQDLLRHESIETTHKMYTEDRTAETGDVLDSVFGDEEAG